VNKNLSPGPSPKAERGAESTPHFSPLPVGEGPGERPSMRTTCPYCGVGCGLLATPDGTIKGDPAHPANKGRLCSKGAALGETIGHAGRLTAPRVFGQTVSMADALGVTARRFAKTIADHGPDSVAFYVSGQMLTEDYYVANKLMKGFIGSANIDTNSRLCMASSVAGHRRAFGTDTVPGLYEDLELADLVVLTGSNLAWCHPVLYQRLAAAKAARPSMKIVVIDPRRTATCEIADMHLAIAPGSDAALFNAVLAHIGGTAPAHVTGFDAAMQAARATDPALTGLPPHQLRAFCDLWAATEKTVTVYSQGINQSDTGTDKVNAILNCHLATNRIGRPGMGPFSVTGQPNAMGGREVGGLANMLACHLDIENPDHRTAVQTFWASPRIADKPGLKAVDMFRAVADGRIRAIWIIHTNPVVSMPDADAVRAALEQCPFVVVSDITPDTDTARLAHVLLPATAWGEKSGTVTNSDRTISRQRAFLPAPAQARDDWRMLADVATRMGFAGFAWDGPAAIFREYAALSGLAGTLGSDFDISDHAALTDADYDALKPFTWPQNPRQRGGRFFGTGHYHTPDHKARMLPITPRLPAHVPGIFRLNTGRIRDQWHSMTRTAKSPRLSQHLSEPFLELHPQDAARLNIQPADLVRLSNPLGTATLRVLITHNVAPGHPFAPMHWTAETAPTARIDALVPANTDPVSGQPDLKGAHVTITRHDAAWYAFAVSAHAATPQNASYWARARTPQGWRMELAGDATPIDWVTYARALFQLPDTEAATVIDTKRGLARIAFHQNGHLIAALFAAPDPVALARDHVAARIGADHPAMVLAGQPGLGAPDPGPTVCACMNVGLNTIRMAIESGQALTVQALGNALGAGSSCGSCRPELASLLSRFRIPEAAE
jgi:assimilatory nitrate reductase catalytic subunit